MLLIPRVADPERCHCCSRRSVLQCFNCKLPLCDHHKVCPECDGDDIITLFEEEEEE